MMAEHRKIIAVDFDGCLCENAWPGIGRPNTPVIEALLKEQEKGAHLILWTCRHDELESEAVEWCREQGLEFEAVNQNLPDIIEVFDGDTRKVFANEYWDDKALRARYESGGDDEPKRFGLSKALDVSVFLLYLASLILFISVVASGEPLAKLHASVFSLHSLVFGVWLSGMVQRFMTSCMKSQRFVEEQGEPHEAE